MLNLFQTFGYRESGVKRDNVVQTLRESGLGLFHQVAHALGSFHGIGAGKLVDGKKGGRFSVQPALERIGLRAQFDSRNVLEPKNASIGLSPDNDFTEFLGGGQASRRTDSIGKLPARWGPARFRFVLRDLPYSASESHW